MSKTVVIHQPDFLPHIAFFHRFLHADLWVMLDTVQFVRKTSKSWQNRDKIKTHNGERWITVAVQKSGIETPINQVLLSKEQKWREDHLNIIRQSYKTADYFEEVFPYVEELYGLECSKMIEFNVASIEMLLKLFGIEIPFIKASTLDPKGRKNELLIDIIRKVSGASYLSGAGARDYLKQDLFDDADIKVVWQDFKHPVYPQLHGSFIPYLSSIDLLLNCGIKRSREIIRRS